MAPPSSLPLPRDWRKSIRRALLCAVGLERLALAEARSGFDNSPDPRARFTAELDRLREHCELQAEELRILRARLEHIAPRERPHHPPAERLAILLLRAKRGWNAAETARRFVVTRETIASWTKRLDEEGERALVETSVPVNRFGDGVRLLAHRLHQAAPGFGRRKLADILARAGFHLAASTLRRVLKKPPPGLPPPGPSAQQAREARRGVSAKRVGHVWHADITSIPIGVAGSGCSAPWWPFALILRWVLSWHIALVVDHFSRALVAFALFRREPSAGDICALLDRSVAAAGAPPRYLVSDRGSQFQSEYRAWCSTNGVRPRFGAVGKKGSIAIVERFILSLKREFLWRILVPSSLDGMQQAMAAYLLWYNEYRPHTALAGATPAEVRAAVIPARNRVRLEPRARLPVARGDPSVKRCGKLELVVGYVNGRRELPVVELRKVA
jgi:transposase InsO family protein